MERAESRPISARRIAVRRILARTLPPLLAVLLCLASRPAGAEPPSKGPVGPAPAPTVAVVTGSRVNLRVGPRVGGRPVARMDEGTVLLIVERVPGWFGVRVPRGFEVALAAKYVEPVGEDAVRVKATKLNVRLDPPKPDGALAEAFRDHPAKDAVLPLVSKADGWIRVWAPETIRAYVSAPYVKELGPLSEHMDLVRAARARRSAHVKALAQARLEAARRRAGTALREALGTSQQALYKLRIQRGFDRTPVVRVINALEAALREAPEAPVAVRKLAVAIRQDLEAELEIRMARKDAEVARLRGLEPPAERALEPKIENLEVRGEIRWEAAPRWRNGGAWVLWVGTTPRYVLQLTTGLPRPLPDLKGNAGRGTRVIRGRQSGGRVFGLPVIEVRAIAEPPTKP